jgi:hypothetical protein
MSVAFMNGIGLASHVTFFYKEFVAVLVGSDQVPLGGLGHIKVPPVGLVSFNDHF